MWQRFAHAISLGNSYTHANVRCYYTNTTTIFISTIPNIVRNLTGDAPTVGTVVLRNGRTVKQSDSEAVGQRLASMFIPTCREPVGINGNYMLRKKIFEQYLKIFVEYKSFCSFLLNNVSSI